MYGSFFHNFGCLDFNLFLIFWFCSSRCWVFLFIGHESSLSSPPVKYQMSLRWKRWKETNCTTNLLAHHHCYNQVGEDHLWFLMQYFNAFMPDAILQKGPLAFGSQAQDFCPHCKTVKSCEGSMEVVVSLWPNNPVHINAASKSHFIRPKKMSHWTDERVWKLFNWKTAQFPVCSQSDFIWLQQKRAKPNPLP